MLAEHVQASAQLELSLREISTLLMLIHASAAEHAQAYAHRVLLKRSEINLIFLRAVFGRSFFLPQSPYSQNQ